MTGDYRPVPEAGDKFDEKFRPPQQPSEMDETVLYSLLRDQFEIDSAHSMKWRTQARDEFDFVANEQWKPADKSELEDSGRVAITFNRTLSIIKSVAGIEINGRHETNYLPRDVSTDSAEVSEMLTEASNWMSDGCDAEDEQSDAFQDCCICGMGWTETRIDFEEDPEGMYVEQRVDPLEMVWDGSSRAKNLTDARRVWRVRKMLLSEARERFPGVPDIDLDASWARRMGAAADPAKPIEDRLKREENLKFDYDPKTEVHIVQVQWWERETYWRVIDPSDPSSEPLELAPFEYERLAERYKILGRQIIALELRRRVYKQSFLGGAILNGVKPAPVQDRFTFQCITGERDRNKGTWFGLVRLMHDPQMWANKWLSQSLHILNSTAKGGILAEEDAFPDQREAEETYAQPDAITWVREGAIAKNKIMEKPGGALPTAYSNLLQFAITSIRDVVGINLELLGMRDATQPGILEAQRKQAAMTILATLFDSLRRFRKQIGRIRLFFIQNYLSDGRWIRINGPEGHRFIQLMRDKTLGRFDVIVDDAPTSPNQKEKSWQIIQMMLPAIRDILTPEIVVMILEYSPLPPKLVNSLKEMMKNPDPEKQKMQQLEAATMEGGVKKLMSEALRNEAAAQKDQASAQKDQASIQQVAADAKRADLMLLLDQLNAQREAEKQQSESNKDDVSAQREMAAAEKDLASAANLRAKTVLDFAQAATAASTDMLNKARTSYLEAEAEKENIKKESNSKNMEEILSGGLLEALEGGSSEDFLTPGAPGLPILSPPPRLPRPNLPPSMPNAGMAPPNGNPQMGLGGFPPPTGGPGIPTELNPFEANSGGLLG
jgi:hypothetical protein